MDEWKSVSDLGALYPVNTIFDVGGHHGGVALLARRLFPDASIFTFEPNPAAFTILNENLSGQINIVAEQIALADRVGTSEFHVGKSDFTSSLFPRNTTGRRYYRQDYGMEGLIRVDTTTLDEYTRDRAVHTVDVLKLDLQGAELMALKGATNLLQSAAIKLIVAEAFVVPHYEGAPLFLDTWDFLRGYGYSLFNIFSKVDATNGQFRYCDAIFLSPELRGLVDQLPDEP